VISLLPEDRTLRTLRFAPLLALALAFPALAAAQEAAAINAGDTALVLVSAGLVMLMTPGLAFFYGGLVRSKNVVHTMNLSVAVMGVAGVLWALFTYSLSFSSGGLLDSVIGGLGWIGLRGVGNAPDATLAATIPHSAFMLFQGMFAVITPALISGALVERVRIKAYLLFIALWCVVVYAPVAHWVWAPGGWLRNLGVLDFAGGTVVHINAAAAALVGAILLGKRRGLRTPTVLPHNVPFAILGMGLLWFGWLGFNGGSALAANGLAASAFVNTFFAPAAAALTWGLIELFLHERMSGVGLASGAVAGLVAITPASGFVAPAASLVIGALAAIASFVAVWSVVVYAPVAHWVWAPGGWLRNLGALDFAGGTVVHINAAAAALVFALVLGKRRGLKTPTVLPHNVPFAILGAGLLWFGWLGFNGGSALAANGLAAYAFANTFFAPAAAALVWGLAELYFFHGKMSGVGIASGAVAGLVAITPAAGFVTPMAAIALGAAAGIASLLAVRYRPRLGLDDSLDVVAVHGVAATLGALLTGVLASKAVNPDGADGSLGLLGVQALGVGVTWLWSGGLTFGILKLVAAVTPLRAEEQDEWGGMDAAESGERAYISSDSETPSGRQGAAA
jgi:Amt family ammonium transporter